MNPRDKTAAAKILLEQGWTFDEVTAVLGEPYKPSLNFPPGVREIPIKQSPSPRGNFWPNLPPPKIGDIRY